ncbi:SOS (error prone) mutagenesis protein UmuD (RumA) [Legionella hackeliae]|uniref:Uncharacterized protein n=1 Tax=Legionella hackeliae TaxID=449 RepID=A0A0A8UKK8_LEGHA|nr:hypothetical protein Lhac_1814 [Legionella hackeliae]CEK09253.1 protein of unknown function [Legionella hackeliae]STX49160.1 SOS (error prone) mutagenesis protein UmuD (RumA) [Legionella hackeliae]
MSRIKHYLQGQPRGIPLYSSKVREGFPFPTDDYIESYLDLNEHLIKHPASTWKEATIEVTSLHHSMVSSPIAYLK